DSILDELLSTVKSLNDGWLTTYQSSALNSRGAWQVEVRLLSFVKNDANFDRNVVGNSAKDALLIFTYLGLFFSVSAAVSGLILTDDFGEFPVRASRQRDSMELVLFDSDTSELLGQALLDLGHVAFLDPLPHHWSSGLFSLIAGTVSLITQVLIYVSLEESKPVIITLTVITVFAVLPLVHLVPPSSGRGKRYSFVST
ncbi:hypothetical protein EDB84DRAFT_1658380, partial [Lactarius hengduanensis]